MKKIISFLTASVMCMGMFSLPAYAEENTETLTRTAEELLDALISEDENFSDGGLIYTDKYKTDLINYSPDSDTVATLIVYGFESANDMRYNPPAENYTDFTWICNPTEFHSGFRYYVSARTDTVGIEKGKTVIVMYFANNSVRNSSQTELGLIEGSKYYGFDVAPYIYPEIIAGDTDGDGMITANDASAVLSAYSMLSTGEELILNSTIFDYNNDGLVNASDASAILAKYSELATTPE